MHEHTASYKKKKKDICTFYSSSYASRKRSRVICGSNKFSIFFKSVYAS